MNSPYYMEATTLDVRSILEKWLEHGLDSLSDTEVDYLLLELALQNACVRYMAIKVVQNE